MRIVRLTEGMDNVNFIKDPGMIPYILHKYYGHEGGVASYWEEGFDYLETEVKGLNFYPMRRYTGNAIMDGMLYLVHNAKKIDVLIVYFLARQSFIWILTYKLFNRKGKVYLKGDACEMNLPEFYRSEFKYRVVKRLMTKTMIKMCKLVSVETRQIQEFIDNKCGIRIEYIPNGFYDGGIRNDVAYETKRNVILTVGRIGTEQKATEVLLEAFALAKGRVGDWELRIVGGIEDGFKSYIDDYFAKNPELKNRITFTGAICDRIALDSEYAKAKIFCLPSRWESFGLVYLEALKNGCFIVTSDIPPAWDVTDKERYGRIFPPDDVQRLAEILITLCNEESVMENVHQAAQDFVYNHFYWVDICGQIDRLVNE